MDPAIMHKLQEMEEEMNRFEQEIAVPQQSSQMSYSAVTGGPSLQFLPHQVQRSHHVTHRSMDSDHSMNPLPGIHPDVAASLSNSLYMHQSADYGQAVISAPPQPTVIKATPAVYSAAPVRTQPKVEDLSPPPPPPVPKLPEKKAEAQIIPPYIPPYIRQLGAAASVSASHEESKPKYRKKKMVRSAGGQNWEDPSLLEWDPDDFRIFCGDLGNDVTDEVLTRAFGKFPSFTKARVIRDKRNNKTKGYGFVSFKDPQDFIRAMKEMNGKYVGSRPIKLRKSTWKDRNIEMVRKKNKEKHRLGLRYNSVAH